MTDEERARRLLKALEYGGNTHTVADVVEMIEAGRAQFWQNDEGCIVSELENFPRLKCVRFWLISGELKACLALEDEIISWALKEGCTKAIATGRKGWGYVAAPTGWKPQPHAFNFYKDLVP